MFSRLLLLGLTVAGFAGAALGAECDIAKAQSKISFANTIEPVLVASCTLSSCHTPINPPNELVLAKGLAYRNLVNLWAVEVNTMRLVEPGDPETSYLMHKLRGTHIDVGGVGERMPFDLPALTDDQIATIAAWIKDCSPNN